MKKYNKKKHILPKQGKSTNNFKSNGKRKPNYQDDAMIDEKSKGFREGKAYAIRSRADSNDPQWYYKQEQILNDVASFSFSHPLGARIDLSEMYPSNPQSQFATSIPGVWACDIALAPGISVDAQSPLNLGAQNVYTFVRKSNSGAINYNAPDLMLYLIAMDSLYSAWNWMKRIYGEASVYSQVNKYKPLAYAAADRVDLENIVSNLADYRAYLNMAANRISSFCVPATFNLMVRHSWMFSNIYTDSETTKAQNYMFTPAVFYQYDETTSPNGGVLAPVNIGFTPTASAKRLKFTDLQVILDDMINALQYSEDIGTMSGDILKAYGEGGLFKLSLIDTDYKIDAVYNREVLTQFENAVFWGNPNELTDANLNTMVIAQDPNTNWIKFQPVFDTGENSYTNVTGNYVNFHWDNPTPADVLVATRLNIAYENIGTGGNHKYKIIDCGTEIALRQRVFTLNQGSSVATAATSGPLTLNETEMGTVSLGGSPTVATNTHQALMAKRISLQQCFDWCPQLYMFFQYDGNPAFALLPLRDWDVFTKLTRNNYAALNQLALLSMYNIPN